MPRYWRNLRPGDVITGSDFAEMVLSIVTTETLYEITMFVLWDKSDVGIKRIRCYQLNRLLNTEPSSTYKIWHAKL
jgi:hypothetical protein